MNGSDNDQTRQALEGLTAIERMVWGGVIARQVGRPDSRFARRLPELGPRGSGMFVATLLLQVPTSICFIVMIVGFGSTGRVMHLVGFSALAVDLLLVAVMVTRAFAVTREGKSYRARLRTQ